MNPFLSGVGAQHTATFQCEDNSWDVAASVQLLFSVAGHFVPHGRFHFLDVLQTAVLIRAYLCQCEVEESQEDDEEEDVEAHDFQESLL